MPLQMDEFRRRFDEILHRVDEAPESRTPAIITGVAELRQLLSEFVASGEELYYKIEELLAMREALELDRNQYRELFESAPDAHIVTDFEGQIRFANRAAATLLQVRPNTLASQSLLQFVGEADRARVHGQVSDLKQRTPPVAEHWPLVIRPRQEESFPVIVTVATTERTDVFSASIHWVLREGTPLPPSP